MSRTLLLIDVQNDYFPDGAFPLWNAEAALDRIEQAAARARALGVPVVLVQHVADPAGGISPFFNEGSDGVAIHPRALAAAPDAPIVVKHYADSFEQTTLGPILRDLGTTELLIGGMMTQNCVTHTAISREAERYDVTVLVDTCTTVDELIHGIALHAISTRVTLLPWEAALSS